MSWSRPVDRQASFVNAAGGSRLRIVSQPADGPWLGTIIWVHAFAEEMNKTRRIGAQMARHFASSAWRVVQWDLYGCGDSAGDFADASWSEWLKDIDTELLQADSARPIWLWCVRAGALLGAVALVGRPDVNLLLWQPVTSGARHLQQFLRLSTGARVLGSAKGASALTPIQSLRTSFAVTLVASLTFRSYWALVIGMATGRVTGLVMSYVMQPFRPRLSLSRAGELFSFSGWMLVNNIATVIIGRLPQIYVGRVFGAQLLGAYTVGSEIANLPHTELVAPINRAMFPGYSRLIDDPETFRRVCIEATAAILLIVLPVSAAVAVLAEPIVRVLLGDQWHDAVPIIQILAFAGAVAAVNSNNFSAYLALGKPQLSALILVTRVAVFLAVAFAFAPNNGVVAVAYAEFAAAVGSLLVSLPILFASIRLRVRDYLASLWRPLLASAIGAAAVHAVVEAMGRPSTVSIALTELLVGFAAGAVLYPGILWLLWRLAGRPEAIETMIGRRVRDWLAGYLKRGA